MNATLEIPYGRILIIPSHLTAQLANILAQSQIVIPKGYGKDMTYLEDPEKYAIEVKFGNFQVESPIPKEEPAISYEDVAPQYPDTGEPSAQPPF